MRQFAQRGSRIELLSTEAKLIYTAFCVFALAALAVSVIYYYELVGDAPLTGARTYYGGEPPPAPAANEGGGGLALPDEGGPALELAPEDAAPEAAATGPHKLLVPMTARKLLEVTHFHLFTMPVFLLIIAHLFMLCAMPRRLKLAVIVSAVSSTAAHVGAPWVAFQWGAGFAWLLPVSGVWMTASMVVLIGWPVIAMWRSPRPPGSAQASTAEG